jgi:hypothetical protein
LAVPHSVRRFILCQLKLLRRLAMLHHNLLMLGKLGLSADAGVI